MPGKMINLRTLSETLGLSQTTVSRALNGFPEVSEKTRARVIEAARRHNYRPSRSAASLATGKSHAIGHVVTLSEHMMINPHFSDFIAGAGEAYSRHGYDMLIRVAQAGEEERIYRELAARKGIDGVVVHAPQANDPRIPLLHSLDLPFVVHGRSDHPEDSYSWLDVNNRRAFRRATEFLIDLGHRRIALVNGLESMNFATRRRQGYEDALKGRGIDINSDFLFSEDMLEPYGYRAANALLDRRDPPTALLVSSILPALGVLRALGEKRLAPGRDASIIVYDDCLSFLQSSGLQNGNGIPFFSAIRSSIREAGSAIGEMLIGQIGNPSAEPKNQLWEAELVIGQTTGAAMR